MTLKDNITYIPVGYRRQLTFDIGPSQLAKQTLNFSICSATLGLAQLVFTAMFIGCLNYAASNQSCRARSMHFKAILRQNIFWLLRQDPEDFAACSIK